VEVCRKLFALEKTVKLLTFVCELTVLCFAPNKNKIKKSVIS